MTIVCQCHHIPVLPSRTCGPRWSLGIDVGGCGSEPATGSDYLESEQCPEIRHVRANEKKRDLIAHSHLTRVTRDSKLAGLQRRAAAVGPIFVWKFSLSLKGETGLIQRSYAPN